MTQIFRRSASALLLALLGGSAAATPAYGQLGGLIKKKVAETVINKAVQGSYKVPTFDEFVLELTPERLAGWIKGAQASQRFNETPSGPPHFMALRQPISKKLDEIQLNVTRSEELRIYEGRVGDFKNCVQEASSVIRREKRSAMRKQGPPSPALMKSMMEFGMAVAAAQQRGDAAEVDRLKKQQDDQFNPTPAELAGAEAKCGVPAQSATVKEALSLQAQLAQLDESIRKATEELQKLQEAESGMTARQYAVAFERICDNIRTVLKKEAVRLSPIELQAFKDKQAELLKLCPEPK